MPLTSLLAYALCVLQVGYGDYSPSTVGMRYVAIFMIFLGIMFIFPLLTSGVAFLSGVVTHAGRLLVEKIIPTAHVDLNGDGQMDYAVPEHPLVFYGKNLIPSLSLNLAVQFIFAGIFSAVEGYTYGLTMYHCLVTATTVGCTRRHRRRSPTRAPPAPHPRPTRPALLSYKQAPPAPLQPSLASTASHDCSL